MLFASDLDQTLIYSHRTPMSQAILKQIRPVEWLEDRYISYMTQNALNKLREISSKVFFVPVTTRTKVQYLRINLHQYGILPQYAVTSNGGTIYYRGLEDLDWTDHIRAGRDLCLAADDLVNEFEKLADPSWVLEGSGKMADDLFYYCLINREKIPLAELAAFKLWVNENNWELSVQGRKLYLVPRNVNKKAAIQYIREREGLEQVIAAGDSLLDLEMLQAADSAIVPAHGELFSLFSQGIGMETLKFTLNTGIEAAEEILEYVGRALSKQEVV